MKSERWRQVEAVLNAALECADGERSTLLEQVCRDDAELRREVESLLSHDAPSENFIETSAFNLAAEVLANKAEAGRKKWENKRFGAYRIIREIGRGGMGAVFLAERTDGEFERQVALKIIRQTFADAEMLRRFRTERQILATLNHPHIAHLLDGGVSVNDEPFIVMEYVAGESLLKFAAEHDLTIDERLRLFLKICAGVAYAHQNLIIHRDIKPSNILVNAAGEPKLLDFGLAKILDGSLTDATNTATTFRAFTPSYASPEQIRGGRVTTASDIYSLGAVLYELLTGVRAFNAEHKSYEQILREITETEPVKPSAATGDRQLSNGAEVEAPKATARTQILKRQSKIENRKSLRGDLDNIVLTAMRKDPQRRYASVAQFAEDIERHLKNLPIRARQDAFTYRALKFVKRNRTAAVSAILILFALVGGLVAALLEAGQARVERDRAQRRFNDVRQLSNALLSDIAPKIERLQGSTEAREVLVNRALKYLDSLADEAQNDPQLQSELAAAYEKVGALQGDPTKPNLSDYVGAIASYEKAKAIRQKLLVNHFNEAENRRALAENFRELSGVRFWQNDTQGSLADSEAALKIYQELIAENPASLELKTAYVETQIDYGQTYALNNQYREALPIYRKALASLEELDKSAPHNDEIARLFVKDYAKMGDALSWDDQQTEAETTIQKALTIAEPLAAKHPNDADLQQELWSTYMKASSIYETYNDALAFEYARQALKIAESMTENDRADVQARENSAKSYSRLGVLAANLQKLSESLSDLQKSLAILTKLETQEPKNLSYKRDLGNLYTRFGDTFDKRHDLPNALKSFEASAETFETIARTDSKNTLAQRNAAQALKSAGAISLKLAQSANDERERQHYIETAKAHYRKALDILTTLKAQNALGGFDKKLLEETQTGARQVERMTGEK